MPWGKASGTGLAGESLLGTPTDGLRYTRCSLRGTKKDPDTKSQAVTGTQKGAAIWLARVTDPQTHRDITRHTESQPHPEILRNAHSHVCTHTGRHTRKQEPSSGFREADFNPNKLEL